MAHEVFISYASQDKLAAVTICTELEARGLRCWMAPRDIVPGVPWAESIIDALETSKVMLLLFSAAANLSVQIPREVERAVHKDVPVVPVRLEEALPTRTVEYFISTTHWFDAIQPPLEQHMERLAQAVTAVLARSGDRHATKPRGTTSRESALTPGRYGSTLDQTADLSATVAAAVSAQEESYQSAQGQTSRRRWRSRLTTSIAAAVVLATGAGMFWTWGVRTPLDAPRAATEPIDTPAPSEPVRPTQSSLPQATSASDEVLRRLPRDDRKGKPDQSRPVSDGQPLPPARVEPQTSAGPAVVTAPPGPPAPSPAVESPPPDAVSPPPVETATPERAASANPKTTQTPSEAEEVLLTLRRWEAAFEALDVSSVTQVFLSLGRDQREEVRKTFSGMRVYEVEIRNPRVEVQVDLATVHAIVARRMTRVEGRTVANQIATEFRLRRVDDVWLITEVIPRGRVKEETR